MGSVIKFEKKKRRRPVSDPLPNNPLERDISNAIRSAVNRLPYARLFRNNTGCLKDERGQYVHYGLAIGSSDLIGLVVSGHGHARFVAIEVKRAGEYATREQTEWLASIRALNGVAGVARTVRHALELVAEARGVAFDVVLDDLRKIVGEVAL